MRGEQLNDLIKTSDFPYKSDLFSLLMFSWQLPLFVLIWGSMGASDGG
jgi:hypothetical protein